MRIRAHLWPPALAVVVAVVMLVAGPVVNPGAAKPEKEPPAPIAGFVVDHGPFGTIEQPKAAATTIATTRRSRPPADIDGAGGFLYRKGRFTPLATIPDAEFFQHHAINDRGELAGYFVDEGTVLGPDGIPPETMHAFVTDRRGRVTAFDVPGGSSPFPQGINDRGDIAGIYLDSDLVQTGFLRDRKGKVTTIDLSPIGTKARDVNDRGEVVGIYGEPADNELGYVVRGYLRNRDGKVSTIAVRGASETSPYAIDDRGRIVGTYFDAGITVGADGSYPAGSLHGFIRDEGRVTRLDVRGAVATVAYDVNDRGQVVGGYIDARGRQHGFLYEKGRYTTIDAPRPLDPFAMGSIATGINDRGEVVVPEPVIALTPPREDP
jgi:probable HAF family extracellular repeat protein